MPSSFSTAIDSTLVDELGGQNVAGGHSLVILEFFLIDNPKAVPGLQVLGEVDIPAEDGGEIHDLIFGHPRLDGGPPEAGSYLASGNLLAGIEFQLDRFGHEALGFAAHFQRLFQAVGVIEAVQLAIFGELEGEFLPGAQHAKGVAAIELIDQVQIRGAEPQPLEDDAHVVATAHFHLSGDIARFGRNGRLPGLCQQIAVVRLRLDG